MHYKTIFVSDVHLGTRDCQADKLNNFLKHNTCETLYLVGDIIDAWKIQQNKWRWKQSHTNVVRRILGHAKRGTRVIYVVGNHDEFLRSMIPYGVSFGSVEICNQADHTTIILLNGFDLSITSSIALYKAINVLPVPATPCNATK